MQVENEKAYGFVGKYQAQRALPLLKNEKKEIQKGLWKNDIIKWSIQEAEGNHF